MSTLLGVSGWLLVGFGVAGTLVNRCRLARHAEEVARACHELRAPITAARLGLELAVRVRELPSSRVRAIELELARASLALEDLSSARAGFPPARVEPVDLKELAADSVEAWRAVAAVRGASVTLDCPGGEWRVLGDRLRLAQALGNLIANGVEHGRGQVEVRLRHQPGKLRIEVVDGGPGLPSSLDQLCRPGRRLRGARPSERGHGLAIVSAIASHHGGRLAAAPSVGGARLVLELPAAADVTPEMGVLVRL
jgi:signal transduction histidine kinase